MDQAEGHESSLGEDISDSRCWDSSDICSLKKSNWGQVLRAERSVEASWLAAGFPAWAAERMLGTRNEMENSKGEWEGTESASEAPIRPPGRDNGSATTWVLKWN